MKRAQPGTISHGTLRTEDLLTAFATELKALIHANGRTARQGYIDLLDHARAVNVEADPELASEIVNDLCSALDEYSPEGHYFGAHPGDGSDFGFWPLEEEEDNYPHFDCLKDGEPS